MVFAQLIELKNCVVVPLPITRFTSPYSFVTVVCDSVYTELPIAVSILKIKLTP